MSDKRKGPKSSRVLSALAWWWFRLPEERRRQIEEWAKDGAPVRGTK